MLLKDEAGRIGCGSESTKRQKGRRIIDLYLIIVHPSLNNILSIAIRWDLVVDCTQSEGINPSYTRLHYNCSVISL